MGEDVSGRNWWASARVRTWALSAALALVAFGLTYRSAAAAGQARLLAERPGLLALVTVLFYLAEQYWVSVEFRRESHSLTFAGVPLVLGALMLPVHELVLARVLGSLVAFARQRPSADKAVYNSAGYAFEAALDATVLHALVGLHPHLGLITAGTVLLVVGAVDQLMSSLVLIVIRWHSGSITRAEVTDVLLYAGALCLLTTSVALAAAMLLSDSWLGLVLMLLMVGFQIRAYRSHAAISRRHEALASVHDFVVNSVTAESAAALATAGMRHLRQLVRAGAVEVLLATPGHSTCPFTRFAVDEHDVAQPPGPADRVAVSDWVLTKAMDHRVATLLSRDDDDPETVGWLREHGHGDAMVAPLQAAGECLGAVIVSDRLGETLTFTHDDLTLLQTLAGHFAMALRSRHVLDELQYEATHDSLTGLANRAFLASRLQDGSSQPGHALLLLDLNKFKEVNDVLGHDVGDQLLVVVAQRLSAALPAGCVAARLGGDEFAVLVTGPDAADAEQLARRTRAALAVPVRFGEALLVPECSIGVAAGDDLAVGQLLRCADTAMYAAKQDQSGVAVYDVEMDRGRAERLALLADLRLALDRHPEQFVAYYQPKFHLSSRRLVGAEALVRWLHPELGTINPDRFVPLAETSGLVERLTEHMLLQALDECARWHRAGHDLSVAVNVSPRTVRDTELPAHIDDLLRDYGLPADRLILEITESSVMADPERAVPILRELVERGIVLSLDDFGTGYSSLSYLQQLPVHELKIDRSFVSRLGGADAPEARTLVSSIIALGRNLGLRVVAEGIETEQQYADLLELGCHVGQGYLVSRPLPPAALRELLDQQPVATARPHSSRPRTARPHSTRPQPHRPQPTLAITDSA